MRFSDDKIEEIRAAADIVDVVSGFVRLKKAGRNFTGLCPFHKEKTPSFNVNPERGIFKCFGCGKGGNAITFLMDVEHVSFVEALEELAERYGIEVPREQVRERADATSLDALYEANRVAARFFYTTLREARGTVGKEYFRRRKWTAETQQSFGLGFAPDAWDALIGYAHEQGVTDEVLEQTGLVVRRDTGRVYDRFRNRVVFPIFSVTKKVIGFGARALAADEQPKYLNSPETAIYNKSSVLYGLSHAHRSIREAEAAILVEGYADVISMHQAGITNVVSTSGTALTPEQVKLLARYTSRLFFLYDADAAGASAMMRGIEPMLAANLDVRIVTLPQGEDPDSYVLKEGADAVRARMAEARSFLDFVVEDYRTRGMLETPEGKTEAVRHVVGLLLRMPDRIKRDLYVHHLAERFRVYESVLYRELDALARTQSPAARRAAAAVREERAVVGAAARVEEAPRAEAEFVRMLFEASDEVRREVLAGISLAVFRHPVIATVMHEVLEQHEHDGRLDLRAVEQVLREDVHAMHVYAGLVVPRESVSEHWRELQTVRHPDLRSDLLLLYKRLLAARVNEDVALLERRLQYMAADDPGGMEIAAEINTLKRRTVEIKAVARFDELTTHAYDIAHDAGEGEGSPF